MAERKIFYPVDPASREEKFDLTGFTQMVRKPNPVWMQRQEDDFIVVTNEGELRGNAGDYLAHDPVTGYIWPVSQEYAAVHYEIVMEPTPQ